MLHEPAWAKVNLYLQIVGKRTDGYHLLDSLAVFPAVGDRLSVAPDSALSLVLTGPFGASLVAEPDNLVLRAARALQALCATSAGARIVLEKRLPVASGIGGGSADAAAALRLLCRLWNVRPDSRDLVAIAAKLGADVPVCLQSSPARMQGIGDVLAPAPDLPDVGLVLINPGVAVSTPDVFRARSGGMSPVPDLPARWPDSATMARDLGMLRNDLEPPAIGLCPVIGTVLEALRAQSGCLLARMSGSGATCFGLFESPAVASHAAVNLAHSNWWIWGGGMSTMTEPT